jgi:hypothetical protein
MIEKQVTLQESDNITIRYHENLDAIEIEQNNENLWFDPKDLPEVINSLNGFHMLIISRGSEPSQEKSDV